MNECMYACMSFVTSLDALSLSPSGGSGLHLPAGEVRALPAQTFQHIPAHLQDLVALFPAHCQVRVG